MKISILALPFVDSLHSEQAYGELLNKVDKSKSNWKMRNILQKQNLEPLLHKGPSQSINNPYTFKSIYDVNYPSIDSFNSDLKNNFLEKEKFQAKLIAPAINVNLKLPRI